MRKIFPLLMVIGLGGVAGCSVMPIGPYNGFSNDPMTKIVIVKYPRPGGVPWVTKKEFRVIRRMANYCQLVIGRQLSTPAEAAGAAGALYGVTGGVGVASGALAFPGAIFHRYFQYGGAASGMNGAAYGWTMWSYNDAHLVGACTRDFVKKAGLDDIFIYSSYVRARHPRREGGAPVRTEFPPPRPYRGGDENMPPP